MSERAEGGRGGALRAKRLEAKARQRGHGKFTSEKQNNLQVFIRIKLNIIRTFGQ